MTQVSTEATFLDLHLSISSGIVSTKVCDGRDDFEFEIVNFPCLDGDVPRSASYGVCVFRLVRFAGASGIVAGFGTCSGLLTWRLLEQGCRCRGLRKTFSEFFWRYCGLISGFRVDFDLFCARDFRSLVSVVAWCVDWRRLLALIIFQLSSLK